MTIFLELSSLLYRVRPPGTARPSLVASAWLLSGLGAIVLAGLSFFPLRRWLGLARQTGHIWFFALAAAVSACFAGNMARWFWQPGMFLSRVTLSLTADTLRLLKLSVIADPHTMTLGTNSFHVEISQQCSGLEGIGLIVAFGLIWLILFRGECRFPQSLVLVPVGAVIMFSLNVVRIAALVVIGIAGAPEIAEQGFHSQAGWIAFSVVAVGFCFFVVRIPWFRVTPSCELVSDLSRDADAIFLLPFLAILGSGMLEKAFMGTFDWLYPLRFVVAIALLWSFRKSYANLDWKCDWRSVLVGLIVFIVWILNDRFFNAGSERGIPAALKASTAISAILWITCRVLAAVIVVPLAEELAFRGFLMRRFVSRNVASVSFRNCTWFALIASSIAFGLLHGGFRLAGTIAGVLFGLAVIRKGRLGEAVMAHATANALLAFYVLRYQQWHLW